LKINKLKFFFIIILVIQIFYLFQFRSGFQYKVLKNPFIKDSGIIYALSPAVIESKKIIKLHKLTDFNLSKLIKKDHYLYQRTIEFNYPVKNNENSEFTLLFIEENVSSNCKLEQSEKYLKLVKC